MNGLNWTDHISSGVNLLLAMSAAAALSVSVWLGVWLALRLAKIRNLKRKIGGVDMSEVRTPNFRRALDELPPEETEQRKRWTTTSIYMTFHGAVIIGADVATEAVRRCVPEASHTPE